MVPRLRELLKEWGVRGYSRKIKAELTAMLKATPDARGSSTAQVRTQPSNSTAPQLQT